MESLFHEMEIDGIKVISARELYDFLGITERFSRWMDRMLEYGFKLNEDYTPYQMVHPQNGQQQLDYALTRDCTKHIGMLQRTEKGTQVRDYYIACEKLALSNQTKKLSNKDLAQMVIDEANRAEAAEKQLAIQTPRYVYATEVLDNSNCMPINDVALELGMSSNKLNKILHEKGIQYHEGGQVVFIC